MRRGENWRLGRREWEGAQLKSEEEAQPLTSTKHQEQNPWPSGNWGGSGAAFDRSSGVTLARSLFSLSHSCLICQVGMKELAQSVLQRSKRM